LGKVADRKPAPPRAADEGTLMAQKTTSQRSGARRGQSASSRNARGSSTNRRQSSQNGDGARPALRARQETNDANREYRAFVGHEEQDPAGPPDVLLDVPELKIDLIHFELDELDAHVALKAKVLNLVKLNVGVDVHLSRTKLDIKGVEAEVVLKARLDHVTAIVDRLMTSLDRNPELVKGLSRAVSDIGEGAGEAVDKTGDAAKDVGKGAQSALTDVGKGAGEATGDIGEGAGQAVGDVGQGAGQAVGDVGQGAGQAVGDVGQGAGQAVGNVDQVVGGVGQTVGQAGQGASQALGGLGQGAGQVGAGATQALGGLGGGAGQASGPPTGQGHGQPANQLQDGGRERAAHEDHPNGDSPGAASPGALAKEVAKMVAREVGSTASDEARDLGLAATRKVRELSQRRQQRRAEKHEATEAAVRIADELGIDLAQIEGTGSDGRITVKDVRQAQEA
jgi:hypothetical protein